MQNYHIESRLGQGSSASVFRVLRVSDRNSFVLKRLCLENASQNEIALAEREMLLLSQLDHPNVVGLIEHFEAHLPQQQQDHYNNNNKNNVTSSSSTTNRGDLCLILEPMLHGDLHGVLSNLRETSPNQPIAESIVMTWFVQTALAVHYLHSRSTVHGDIKSANLFVDSDAQFVAIGDLGSAFVDSQNSARSYQNQQQQQQQQQQPAKSWEETALGGTVNYFSPERFSGEGATFSSDIWALGLLLFEMAALSHPFADCRDVHALVVKVCRGEVPLLPAHVQAATGGRKGDLQKLIEWMLQPDVKSRPTVEQVLKNSYVQRHLDSFLRSLLAPPEAEEAEHHMMIKKNSNQQQQQASNSNSKNKGAGKSARWHRFIVGHHFLNPHRLRFHPAVEAQVSLFLPQLAAEYFGGTQQQPAQQNQNNNNESSSSPSSKQEMNIQPHSYMPYPKNNNNNSTSGNKSKASSSSNHNSPMTNKASSHHQQQQQQRLILNVEPTTEIPRVAASNIHVQKKREELRLEHGSQNFSPQAQRRQQQPDSLSGTMNSNSTPTKSHGGGAYASSNSNNNSPEKHVVSPERMNPNSLKPFLHQQLPLTQIRSQKAKSPFWVDDSATTTTTNTPSKQNSSNNNSSNSRPTQMLSLQDLLHSGNNNNNNTSSSSSPSSNSKAYNSGGGVSTLQASNDSIARTLRNIMQS